MRTRSLLLAALVPALAACAGAGPEDLRGGAPDDVRDAAPGLSADPLASLPSGGPVARYGGAFARDPALLAFQREAPAVFEAAVARLHEETGLQFAEGREPRLTLTESPDVPPEGRADLRLTDGVRRPEIRVRAAAVASGEFRTHDHLPALLAEAAVLAASPERVPPAWVLRGLPLVFARQVDRRAAELLAGGAAGVGGGRADAAALEPLEPCFRVAALRRVGVGERALQRFLEMRLSGSGDAAALREVGIGSMDFLDAAAATEASRTLERVTDDERLALARAARAALASDDLPGAEALLARSPQPGAERTWIDGELAVVRAETSLLHGETRAAVATLDDMLSRPGTLVRLRDARFLRALAALRDEDPAARSRAASFARCSLEDPRARDILADLGVETQVAFDLASSEAAVRARAAARAGQGGKPSAAAYLRACLTDGDAAVRAALLQSMAALAPKDVAADLDAACGDSDAAVRRAALTALAAIDGDHAARRAQGLLGDPDADVRRIAAEVAAHAVARPVAPAKPPADTQPATAPPPPPPPGPRATNPSPPAPGPATPPKPPAASGPKPIDPPVSPGANPAPKQAQPGTPPASTPATTSATAKPPGPSPTPGSPGDSGGVPPKPERDVPPPAPRR